MNPHKNFFNGGEREYESFAAILFSLSSTDSVNCIWHYILDVTLTEQIQVSNKSGLSTETENKIKGSEMIKNKYYFSKFP